MTKPLDTLIKWPTRSRPDLFWRQLDRWQRPDVRFLVSIDEDDPTCNSDTFLLEAMRHGNVRVVIGRSRGKIHAINRDLENERFDLLIAAADDMTPQRPDWLQHITDTLFEAFPDGDGVLHVNDGRTGRKLNTLPIMGEKYFRRFGYVYHPAYQSLWADNEFQAVAERAGRSVYVDEVLIRHEWVDLTGKDELHLRNELPYHADAELFERRKAAGFPPAP